MLTDIQCNGEPNGGPEWVSTTNPLKERQNAKFWCTLLHKNYKGQSRKASTHIPELKHILLIDAKLLDFRNIRWKCHEMLGHISWLEKQQYTFEMSHIAGFASKQVQRNEVNTKGSYVLCMIHQPFLGRTSVGNGLLSSECLQHRKVYLSILKIHIF